MSSRTKNSAAALAIAVAAAIVLACSPPSPSSGRGTASDPDTVARAEGDSVRIARLEREARALAKASGCARSEQCRVAPVGHRACGGPRTYLPYCALTTDSAALFAKLDELARAEEEYDRKRGVVSTCLMRVPPTAGFSGGRCTAAEQGAGDAAR